MSFGGPESPEEVVPFLKNVTAGRGIPEERLVEVGEHYYGFGGKSPINDQNKALLAALRDELARECQLVDMEGYALAAVCSTFGVPLTLLKQVSDSANEESKGTWANVLDRGARQLASAATDLGFLR